MDPETTAREVAEFCGRLLATLEEFERARTAVLAELVGVLRRRKGGE